MAAQAFAPGLVVVSAGEDEPLLPDSAEGPVEIYAGNDGFEAYGYAAGGHCWAHLPGLASFRFRADESGEWNVVAITEAGASRARVEDAYLRNVLPLVMHVRGYEVLHASAVSTESGLLVLCGVSGAGKSTFASALAARGHPPWADDAVVLDVDGDGDEAIALQVPFRLGLRSDAATRMAADAHNREHGDSSGSRTRLLALLVLGPLDTPNGSLVDVTRLPLKQAFTALVPHAYYFRLSDAARTGLMIDRYMQLASSVPTFDVRYRRGFDHLDTVVDVLEKHMRPLTT